MAGLRSDPNALTGRYRASSDVDPAGRASARPSLLGDLVPALSQVLGAALDRLVEELSGHHGKIVMLLRSRARFSIVIVVLDVIRRRQLLLPDLMQEVGLLVGMRSAIIFVSWDSYLYF